MENMDVDDSSGKNKSGRPVESECMKPINLQEYSHILRALQEQNTQLLPLGTTNATLARIVYNLQCFLEVLYIKSSQNSILLCNHLYIENMFIRIILENTDSCIEACDGRIEYSKT